MQERRALLLLAPLLAVSAILCPVSEGGAVGDPVADFDWMPQPVVAGTPVVFRSTSIADDEFSPITTFEWDLAGTGTCSESDPYRSPTCTTTAPAPGSWEVSLEVHDIFGEDSSTSKTVPVQAPPQAPPQAVTPAPMLLSPFPIVRLVGSVTSTGTRIDLLSVRAPAGSRAVLRCRGRRCPVRRTEKTIRGRGVRLVDSGTMVPPGVVLEVLVSGGDRIGKFTRFSFRRERRPRRTDACLWPGKPRIAPCPEL
jgi:hypothetical protein